MAEQWDDYAMEDLPERLLVQANNVEEAGFLSAARLMREAAAELQAYREKPLHCPCCDGDHL